MSQPLQFMMSNKLNTTTMLVVPANNTGTQEYLLDRNPRIPFTSSGFDSNSSCVISIVFPQPTVLSHIMLQNHNVKQFRIYYNSVTANSLSIVTQNSQTSTYISFNSTTMDSVDIQLDIAMTASSEKSIGEYIVTEKKLAFTVNPSADNYDPTRVKKSIRHEMPDGGVKMLQVSHKFKAGINLSYVTDAFASSLESVYFQSLALCFVPFGTTTGWGGNGMGEAYDVLWTNDWNFKHGTNDRTQGLNGSIYLEETPSA